jgi:hypothetical protein
MATSVAEAYQSLYYVAANGTYMFDDDAVKTLGFDGVQV